MKVISRLFLTLCVVGAVVGTEAKNGNNFTEEIMVYLATRRHHPITDYVLGKWLSRQGPRTVTQRNYAPNGRRIEIASTIYPFGHFLSANPEVIPTFDRLAAQPYWFERTPIFTLCHLASKERGYEVPNQESETYARITKLPAAKQKLFELTHWSKRSNDWVRNYPRRLIDFK